MNVSDFDPHKKATRVVVAVLLTAAVSGFFMGLKQTASTINITRPAEPSVPAELASLTSRSNEFPVVVEYARVDRRKNGPNSHWYSDVQSLVEPPAPQSVPENVAASEEDRLAARKIRAIHRAYDGAPPVVPHPIDQLNPASCLACHGDGRSIRGVVAPKMSHEMHASCIQCHVPTGGARIPVSDPELLKPIAGNSFAGLDLPGRRTRALAGAPPTIPHPTLMRSDCMSCHGPRGAFGLKTPHADRSQCQQCHVPSAVLDQRQFTSLPEFFR